MGGCWDWLDSLLMDSLLMFERFGWIGLDWDLGLDSLLMSDLDSLLMRDLDYDYDVRDIGLDWLDWIGLDWID